MSGVSLQSIGDLGKMPNSLPTFFFPDIPLNLETLKIIFPYSLALAIVGLLESLLTSQVLDDMTDTESNKNTEARGQGIANFITGFFGGMAGCALIGQSIINIKSGGRGRLSTFTAGVFLMFLIIVLGDVVVKIPMPVLSRGDDYGCSDYIQLGFVQVSEAGAENGVNRHADHRRNHFVYA